VAADSLKTKGWAISDRIVADAAPDGQHTNPWKPDGSGGVVYEPDLGTLTRLLGVPLYLNAASQSGVPALALDVWMSYELRRAGFDPDAVWPRPSNPRVLPAATSRLLAALPKKQQQEVREWFDRKQPAGAAASTANILGKNYLKQVDVVISDWQTGPELLISTKRMDSSFGKNAANRVEESYGDAKNLRLRHPLAALGFVYGLRSTVLTEAPDVAEWIIDLLGKLGREDDAYHAVALLMLDYDVAAPDTDPTDQGDTALAAAGLLGDSEELEDAPAVASNEVEAALAALPVVKLRLDAVPAALQPGRFLATMTLRVLDATPVNLHKDARARLRQAQAAAAVE
jgi:hypothetical protein